jgi:NAD(P)-dependent dehydrogenase (short-subunit alcohol dehydrogenase family)
MKLTTGSWCSLAEAEVAGGPVLMIDLSGKIAAITGGASGIGLATADLFQQCGCRVVIIDRAKTDVKSLRSGQVEERNADVCDAAAVAAAVNAIEADVGPIDILVNSAGILERPLAPAEAKDKEWDRVVSTNLKGTYLCCRQVGLRMAARGCGAIVNVSSVAGLRSSPLHAYGPSKAAVINLTEGLAAEWGRMGVRVNAVAPGFTRTPALALAAAAKYADETLLAEASGVGRLVRPGEVANAIAFLACDLAAAITGVTLPVDCGYLVAGSWAAYGGLRRP